jgi:putative transposase
MGFALFRKAPTSVEVRSCLGRAIGATGTAPRYLVSDKGSQFFPTADYKIWCRHHGIRPRFGALGKHGSIAVLERAVRTIKEALQRIIVPTRREAMRTELVIVLDWYNQHRPHSTLGGKTPDEVYFQRFPANRCPRLEPRLPGRVALRARCLTRWLPANQALTSTWKLSTLPVMSTCRLSDCDGPRSLICVSEL